MAPQAVAQQESRGLSGRCKLMQSIPESEKEASEERRVRVAAQAIPKRNPSWRKAVGNVFLVMSGVPSSPVGAPKRRPSMDTKKTVKFAGEGTQDRRLLSRLEIYARFTEIFEIYSSKRVIFRPKR